MGQSESMRPLAGDSEDEPAPTGLSAVTFTGGRLGAGVLGTQSLCAAPSMGTSKGPVRSRASVPAGRSEGPGGHLGLLPAEGGDWGLSNSWPGVGEARGALLALSLAVPTASHLTDGRPEAQSPGQV